MLRSAVGSTGMAMPSFNWPIILQWLATGNPTVELVSQRRIGHVPRSTPGAHLPQQPDPHEASQFSPRHLARDTTPGHEVSPFELLTLFREPQRLALQPGKRRPRSHLQRAHRTAVGRDNLIEPVVPK
jgi:hypothetical protein